MPDAPPGVGVGDVDQLGHGVLAVADDVGRHPLGDGLHPATHDEAAVVAAGDEGLHHHAAPAGLALGDVEGGADGVGAAEVQAHAAAVVAVQRLDDDRVADPVGRRDRGLHRAHRLAARHRQPRRREQLGGEVLVAGDVDRERAGPRGHGGPDALGVDALAELHQGVLVEADPRDVAADRLLDDRRGRRAERHPLGPAQEHVQLLGEVEALLRPDQVVDQADRQLSGGQADPLVAVGVDHVVDAAAALDLPGLAPAQVVAGLLLQLQRDVLGDVAEPGALVHPLEEAAGHAARAGVPGQARQQLLQAGREPVQGVGGVVLEAAEVEHEVDRGLVGPQVGPAVDTRLEDGQVRRGGPCGFG